MRRNRGTKKKTTKKDPAITSRASRNHIDPEIVRRRQATVNRLRTEGSSLIEVADALLSTHMSGDAPLFTFVGPDHFPLTPEQIAALPYDEVRRRAYDVVRQDVKEHRDRLAALDLPDAERLSDDRYVLAERYRKLLRDGFERLLALPKPSPLWPRYAAQVSDLAARIGRLQGIETEKPMELRLPERYVAWIDGDGIVKLEQRPAETGEEMAN